MQDITKITKNVLRRAAIRDEMRRKEKEAGSREEIINQSFPTVLHDFHCDICGKDYAARARKAVESDWNVPGQNIAYYVAKCPNDHVNKRRIVDKHRDSYFINSAVIKKQRIDFKKDSLQTFESGFEMLYGKNNPYSGGQ